MFVILPTRIINEKYCKMKKLLFILALMAMMSASVFADQNWGGYFNNPTCVQLYLYNNGNHGDRPIDHHAPALLPVLGYDGNTFVLATPYELEDVTIVIRDENGTVLYYCTVNSITDYYMFQLTDDVIADMFSIELYYGDYHLYGEF